MITIHVLGFGDLYKQLLNALAVMVGTSFFASFLRLSALVGIISASVGYIKKRDPMIYGKWIVAYILIIQVAITPKTTVEIYDIAAQRAITVANVPVMFAVTASLITTIGLSFAENYDALLSMPDDLTYTKTGSLFGSKVIQAAQDFKIINLDLKREMNDFFKNCVVGDIRINHKYSVDDLSRSLNIWDLISKNASQVRMTTVNQKLMSCQESTVILNKKLGLEIKRAYDFFGINLFGHNKSNYAKLFDVSLTGSFAYYQHMTDTASNIFLQAMMINAIGDGITNYQAFTNNTASVINNQVSKSQIQHRWAWAIAGQKAVWFLPILHTLLTVLLFGIFPIIIAASTLPQGGSILKGYVQFFISLQFWPVLFAILNSAMTIYGATKSAEYGAISLINLDKINELHTDLSGVAGYLMLMIPFLAKGLVSNLSDAFNQLATSMTGHLQGSAMSSANDAASASFSFGQTSFYNTNANSFAANKHDSNWTNMHGAQSEQLASGVVKTKTQTGDTIFDATSAISKGVIAINSADSITTSLNKSLDESKQVIENESMSLNESLSHFANNAISLSKLSTKDLRLGNGISESNSQSFSQNIATITSIASDVGKRFNISHDDALSKLTAITSGISAGVRSDKSMLGGLAKLALGANAAGYLGARHESSSSAQNRASDITDSGISKRELDDFAEAINQVKAFTKTKHFDENTSQASSLSRQIAEDLRAFESSSHNLDVAKSKAQRISEAQQYISSNAKQISADMNQAFPSFVAEKIGDEARDALFAEPGNLGAIQNLERLGREFIDYKLDTILADFNEDKEYHAKAKELVHNFKLQGLNQEISLRLNPNDFIQKVDSEFLNAQASIMSRKSSITQRAEQLDTEIKNAKKKITRSDK